VGARLPGCRLQRYTKRRRQAVRQCRYTLMLWKWSFLIVTSSVLLLVIVPIHVHVRAGVTYLTDVAFGATLSTDVNAGVAVHIIQMWPLVLPSVQSLNCTSMQVLHILQLLPLVLASHLNESELYVNSGV
jgi:hypothetical protein